MRMVRLKKYTLDVSMLNTCAIFHSHDHIDNNGY